MTGLGVGTVALALRHIDTDRRADAYRPAQPEWRANMMLASFTHALKGAIDSVAEVPRSLRSQKTFRA
jgi:hypothetical protein